MDLFAVHNTSQSETITPPPVSKPPAYTMPDTLSTLCPGIHPWGECLSKMPNVGIRHCGEMLNESICPPKSVITNCRWRPPVRVASMQASVSVTISDCLCRNSLTMHTDCCGSCPGGWAQIVLGVKMVDVEVPGLVWWHARCSREAGWMYQILWNAFGDGLTDMEK